MKIPTQTELCAAHRDELLAAYPNAGVHELDSWRYAAREPGFTPMCEVEDCADFVVCQVLEMIEIKTPCCDIYYCPEAREIECSKHGGFDVSCDNIGAHKPLSQIEEDLQEYYSR